MGRESVNQTVVLYSVHLTKDSPATTTTTTTATTAAKNHLSHASDEHKKKILSVT
jgi:hypothetical protein